MTEQNHEYYVSLEVAKLLKEAGFDWETKSYYADNKSGVLYGYNNSIANWNAKNFFMRDSNGSIFVSNGTYIDSITGDYIKTSFFSAPTLDVAQRWLREVNNYYVIINVADVDCDSIGVFYRVGYVFHDGDKYISSNIWEKDEYGEDNHRRLKIFNTYEEAQEAGILKCLTLLLENNE